MTEITKRNLLKGVAAGAGIGGTAGFALLVAPTEARALTAEERQLSELLTSSEHIREERSECMRHLTQLEKVAPPYVFNELTLADVVGRLNDYPRSHWDYKFGCASTRFIDQFFGHMLDRCLPNFYHPVRDRVKQDWENATSVMAKRCDDRRDWLVSSGYHAIEEQDDQLYDEMVEVEKQIASFPCTTARMAAMKAKRIITLIETDDNYDDPAVFAEILKSLLPLERL